MIKNINGIEKFKKINLIKVSSCVLVASSFFTGCNSKSLDDYYLVSKDGNYSICYRTDIYKNCDDYDYNSIIDNKTIGSICSNGNNFDYENHHFSTEFISEMQVTSLKEVLNKDSMNYNDLINLAKSFPKDIGDNYYKSKKYYVTENFKYSKSSKMEIFIYNNNIIIGYDLSPERLYDENRYIYSIKDMTTLAFRNDDNIKSYSLDSNLSNGYITYDTALFIINKEKEKILKKTNDYY